MTAVGLLVQAAHAFLDGERAKGLSRARLVALTLTPRRGAARAEERVQVLAARLVGGHDRERSLWRRHADNHPGRPGAPAERSSRGKVRSMSDEPQERGTLGDERALQAAMRASDVEALDRLLHPELLAVGPDGRLADKAADLAAHRSGVFTISELQEEELRVRVIGDTAVTFVVLRVRGKIADEEVAGRMRYTRTWIRDDGSWRVMAAHISPAAG